MGLDSFINLCSDEEANPQPQKKRKFTTASEVIFISSDDEAEVSIVNPFLLISCQWFEMNSNREADYLFSGPLFRWNMLQRRHFRRIISLDIQHQSPIQSPQAPMQ